MISAMLKYADSTNIPFQNISYTFPIPGHSCMVLDSFFGRIKKELRRHEEILIPNDYRDILCKHGKVYEYGKDFHVYDYKRLTGDILKKDIRQHRTWKFKKMLQCSCTEIHILVSLLRVYSEVNNSCLVGRKPLLLNAENHISLLKITDVRFLLTHRNVSDDIRMSIF